MRLQERFTRWFGEGYQAEVDRLLARIRTDGPLMARDLATPEARPAGGWWEWHAGKAALEYLWRGGRLAVARRQGFQKVYDLPERVIPASAPHGRAHPRSLRRLGLPERARAPGLRHPGRARPLLGPAHAPPKPPPGPVPISAPSRCRPASRASATGARQLLARPDLADLLPQLPPPPTRLRALNPFDPLLRDRDRLARLFGFDYRIEVFVPAPKRQWGYYVFPLLEADRLIGRLDMKAARAAGTLDVTALWLEPGIRPTRGRLRRLEAELDRVRRFVGLEAVRFGDGFLKGG